MEFNNKQDLRDKVLTLIRNQEELERLTKSLAIADKVYQLPVFKNAKQVLFYASFDGEVDTFSMIKMSEAMGKKIGLPKVDKVMNVMTPMLLNCGIDDCRKGPFGIKEPSAGQASEMKIDNADTLIIVPGVAFDRKNNRLGRGRGFYDRFLTSIPNGIVTIGLAYDFQLFDEFLFVEKHDVNLSLVVTN